MDDVLFIKQLEKTTPIGMEGNFTFIRDFDSIVWKKLTVFDDWLFVVDWTGTPSD